MGTVKVNNGMEYYVTETQMPGLVKWLEENARLAPAHYLEEPTHGGAARPICSALSSYGTRKREQVTCSACLEALGTPARSFVQKPMPPPDRFVRECQVPEEQPPALREAVNPCRVSARRSR
jgi:hypothetical protein